MKTNELKKENRIILDDGTYGTVKDNKKGNVRFCEVESLFTELGSIYAHTIAYAVLDGEPIAIEHTPAQLKLKQTLKNLF
jgi:hypothetical protein